MKSSVIIFIVVCVGIAGAIIFLHRQKTLSTPAAMVASAPVQTTEQTPPEKVAVAKTESPPTISENTNASAQISVSTSANEINSDEATNSIHKMVDALLTAKSAQEKHNLFQQLIKSGQIDDAIAELKLRAAQNPNDPEIPTTLGEAMINKVGAIHAAGGDINEEGILAMQADQSFNAALKIDPQNFEAQLVKSISQTYWPAEPARDAQVVQTLSGLIDRQETMASQPDFAQTYIYLGNEYQKIGQPDKAQATWQLGATKFPNDPTLQKKLAGVNP
jgi:tetratricopeptide (TPR) repeat protein